MTAAAPGPVGAERLLSACAPPRQDSSYTVLCAMHGHLLQTVTGFLVVPEIL